jgi:UDP-N-acetylmuramoylalanine--D-glutamate ligase
MADLSFLKKLDKPVAVYGLGVTGRAVADALKQSGIDFNIWDDSNETREKYKNVYPVKDFTNDLSGYAFLVPPPGMKPTHPVLQKSKILSDIDLLLQSAPDATVIGITGTNGKSTTTALIGHVLQQASLKVAVGGNIGQAACSLPSLDKTGFYVLELSSYQLEITANPVADIAVLLNITPDHLDWHGTLENYKAAKQKIFRQRESKPQQIKILGMSMLDKLSFDFPELQNHPFLKGQHNQENIVAAIDVCRAVGLDDKTIIKHILTFEGLAHRQKNVGQYKNITFINDSKATNAEATSKALASFENIYWIVGGLPKSDGLDGLDRFYPKIKQAYLIGQASAEFAKTLEGKLPFAECGTIHNAVAKAFKDALNDKDQTVILLSPACASFDQYKNFEQRGDDFIAQVNAILKEVAA